MKLLTLTSLLLALAATAEAADLGTAVEDLMQRKSAELFGVLRPLEASAPLSALTGVRTPGDSAGDVVALAKGLSARFVTRVAGNGLGAMVLLPAAAPTHALVCVDSGRRSIGKRPNGERKFNPSIQRINLATGKVATVLRGMDGCANLAMTPWNTLVATEGSANGRLYELLTPMATGEATVLDRDAGTTSTRTVRLQATNPLIAYAGTVVTKDGVVYAGDGRRPGLAGRDSDGGAFYKVIPNRPWDGLPVTKLDQSPLADGRTYALQVSCLRSTVSVGQGCEEGNASWVEVNPATARIDAAAKATTGFGTPAGLVNDGQYAGEGIRACATVAGNETAGNFGSAVCFTDVVPLLAPQPNGSGSVFMSVKLQTLVSGDPEFNSVDGIDIQPVGGNYAIAEKRVNGDVFACLRDGPDRDLRSDGCIRLLSLTDSSATPGAFVFDPTGRKAYLAVSKSNDSAMTSFDGFRTDDLLVISGFRN